MKYKAIVLACAAALMLAGCAAKETQDAPAQAEATPDADASAYIGEYLDADVNEPGLEIAAGSDGKYIVQISIYRLTTLSDGVGTLNGGGMAFTATDAAGDPIGGTITVSGTAATVTFTDSTWEYLPNGTALQYEKSSDTPNIWAE